MAGSSLLKASIPSTGYCIVIKIDVMNKHNPSFLIPIDVQWINNQEEYSYLSMPSCQAERRLLPLESSLH